MGSAQAGRDTREVDLLQSLIAILGAVRVDQPRDGASTAEGRRGGEGKDTSRRFTKKSRNTGEVQSIETLNKRARKGVEIHRKRGLVQPPTQKRNKKKKKQEKKRYKGEGRVSTCKGTCSYRPSCKDWKHPSP